MKNLLFIILTILLINSVLFPGDWTKWRGEKGLGIIDDKNWNPEIFNEDPKITWETNVGLGYSAVAVKGNKLYTMGNNVIINNGDSSEVDVIFCLDANTGKEIWRYAYPVVTDNSWPGPSSTPVIDDNRLYTIGDDTGDLYCFNTENGAVIWHINVVEKFQTIPPYDGVGYSGSPIIEGDMLIMNLNKSGITLNKFTGETIWESPSGRCSFSTPVIFKKDGIKKIALFGGEEFFVLNLKTGEVEGSIKWATNCNENSADPLICPDDKVFISSCYGMGGAMLQLTDHNPEIIWKSDILKSLFSSNVFIDGYIYGIDDTRKKNSFKCIEYKTGKEMWKKRIDFGSFIVANNKIILLTEDSDIYVFEVNPNEYKEISKNKIYKTPKPRVHRKNDRQAFWWTSPVLVNGRLYIRSDKGHLTCLQMD